MEFLEDVLVIQKSKADYMMEDPCCTCGESEGCSKIEGMESFPGMWTLEVPRISPRRYP